MNRNTDSIGPLLDLARAYDEELPAPSATLEPPVGRQIAAWIDHTILKPDATAEDVKNACQEALRFGFSSVCVNPVFISLAAGLLAGSPVDVCVVIGFPFGATLSTQKLIEALSCLNAGANELDMVLNIGAIKGKAYGQVFNEIQAVSQVVHNQGAILKVNLETVLLTREEKIRACLICKEAGADFVITSTGFGPGGSTVEDVDLMHRVVGPDVKVKAAGGILNLAVANRLIRAGASRLGASTSVQIIQDVST